MGRRDLWVADSLESAQHRAALCRFLTTAKTCWLSGMGPAGYTLAHYLVNEGFGVVGVDGLKIEPLDEALTGTAGKAATSDLFMVGSL